jgi:hypothetical protein
VNTRIQLFAIVATGVMFLVVFELVRRRRLLERYALLWLFAAVVLFGLSVWRDALTSISNTVGIYYAPSALFAVAFAFVSLMLLHFSLVISRLTEQNKVLAQQLGLLHQRITELERGGTIAGLRGGPPPEDELGSRPQATQLEGGADSESDPELAL